MEQYLQALRGREDVSEEVIVELEDRFKEVVEEPVEVIPVPTLEERLQMAEDTIMFLLMGGI